MTDRFVHRGVVLERHGAKWRFTLRENGRRVRRSFDGLDAAIAALDHVLDARERRRAAEAVAAAGSMTVERVLREWFVEKRHEVAPATAERYRITIDKHVVPNIGGLDANLLTEAQLKAYYRTRRWKAARESHKVLAMAYDWALDRDMLRIPKNPSRKKSAMPTRRMCVDWWEDDPQEGEVKPVDLKTIPSGSQLDAMLERAAAWSDGRKFWVYLVIGSGTGARPGEICSLQVEDIDFEGCRMRLWKNADRVSRTLKGPKNKWSRRWIPVSRALLELIRPYMPTEPKEYLFPSQRYYGPTPDPLLPTWNTMNLRHRFRKVCRQLCFTWTEVVRERDPKTGAVTEREAERFFTPHSLRHYWATHRLDEGASPTQVAKYLGHKDDTLVRILYGNHLLDHSQQALAESAYRSLFDHDPITRERKEHLEEPDG